MSGLAGMQYRENPCKKKIVGEEMKFYLFSAKKKFLLKFFLKSANILLKKNKMADN